MKNVVEQEQGGKKRVVSFVLGLAAGIIVTGVIVWQVMPGVMLVTHQSRYDSVEETSTQLKAAIEANGWQCPAIRNMNKAMAKYDIEMSDQVRIVEYCHATHAKDILMTNPEFATLMPCAWGVYKGEDGNVYISGMNMGFIGKIFGGNLAKIMGSSVAKNERMMLKRIIND